MLKKSLGKTHWGKRFQQLELEASDYRLKDFYQSGTISATASIVNVPLLAMDFETTGLQACEDEILSIGVQPFTLQRIYCREAQHWLVKPQQWQTDHSVAIHGITHEEVAKAPDMNQILEQLLGLMRGRMVVVHFHPIERQFLKCAVLDRLGEAIEFPLIDTMVLEKRLLMQKRSLLDRLLQRPMPSLRLDDCRQRYGLPHYQSHHALNDALATAELFQAQVAYHFSADDALAGFCF